MQKKLGLACSLIHDPDIILLDEPSTGVDPVSRREFWEILTRLHLRGVTVLVSTPYMDEAERCSRVALLYEGDIGDVRHAGRGSRDMSTANCSRCCRTTCARPKQVVLGLPYVLEVQTYGKLLHVFVRNAESQTGEIAECTQQ